MRYVVGFLFDHPLDNVVLIEKQKPDWQRGKLNGVGGKVEPNESVHAAMAREFREETDCEIELDWHEFAVLSYDLDSNPDIPEPGSVHFFRAFARIERLCLKTIVRTMEIERIVVASTAIMGGRIMHLAKGGFGRVVPNLRWLIPLALSMSDYGDVESFHVREIPRAAATECSP